MTILIHLKKYYDWEKVTDSAFKPSQEDQLAMKYKQDAGGTWLKRVLKTDDTYNTISFPPSEVKNMVDHYERVGNPKSEEDVIATYLEDRLAPHIAPKADWTRIEVEGDKQLEQYLNTRFGLKDK